MALLSVAIYDATIATLDANRPSTGCIQQVRDFTLSYSSNFAVFRWSPQSVADWADQRRSKIFEDKLDANPPRAARAYALEAEAGYDAMVACFDAKYTYWAPRLYQVDATLTLVLPRDAHPAIRPLTPVLPARHPRCWCRCSHVMQGCFSTTR